MFRTHIERHRIPAFLLVVFGWTWVWDVVYYAFGWWDSLPVYINSFPRQWGLPIGAVLVVWASDVPLREWLGRVFQWRFPLWLYFGAVFLPVLIGEIQPAIAALSGGSVRYSPPAPLHLLFGFFLLNIFLFGGVEEFGWRGFLQPQFQERMSVLTASLAVGVLWWTWHLPLFLGHPNFTLDPLFLVYYTTFVLGVSTVLGSLANVTDGAVIPAVVMHAAINVGSVLEGSGGVLEGILPVALVIGAGAWWLIAAILVGLYGRSMTPGSAIEPLS
ncbi:CPBP family intramembrane glutamic endopeptidase [Natrinema halophilum]|uniref:CPBP family intramembrane metalloprotease n=1 Tax=Natrinema halophilum TaxID=1699371 RepID=A0A7D5GVW6_9EURY|nr:CPBP family intramembrane glutamic endopeptidase [Natrinema halophilum]QLG51066.1 CPBP family intramembrane metalloprotease [Natrinema halophilum]